MSDRRGLSMTDKVNILQKIDNNISYSVISKDYNISKGTISGIKKKREDILNHVNQNGNMKIRRLSLSGFGKEIDEMVFQWVCETRGSNITISGPLIQTKAKEVAATVGDINFKASNGWLESFKNRHNISFKPLCAETTEISEIAAKKSEEIPPTFILEESHPTNISLEIEPTKKIKVNHPTWRQMHSLWIKFYDAYRYHEKDEECSDFFASFDKYLTENAMKHYSIKK